MPTRYSATGALFLRTDPSFYSHRSLPCPLHASSHITHLTSPNALCHPSLVDVARQVRGRPRVAPRNGMIAVGWRGWNQAEGTGVEPWPKLYGFTRATSISRKDHCHPLSFIPKPCMARVGQRALIQQKQNKLFILSTFYL